MNKALFAALASVAMLGASCSVQDFSIVVMEKSTITASFPDAPHAAIGTNDITRYYGKYSFRFGVLSTNLFNFNGSLLGKGIDSNTGAISSSSGAYVIDGVPLKPNTTYSWNLSSSTNGGGLYQYDDSMTYLGSFQYNQGTTFTTLSNATYFRFDAPISFTTPMINEGSVALPYQPYAYGFSFDTPVTGVGSCAMDMYYNNGVFMPRHSYLAYNYNDECKVYTDGIHFDFGGDDDLLSEFRAKFLGAYASGRSHGFEWDEDYDGTELVFIPIVDDYTALTYCEFYIEDRYQAGYEDGYADGLSYEIVQNIDEVSLSYITGSGDDSESHNVARGGRDAYALLRDNCINGLLQLDAIYDELIPSADSDAAHDLVFLLSYSEAKTVDAAPIYIDYKQLSDPIPYAQQTELTLSIPVNLPVHRWTAFNAHLDVGYQGDVGNYPQYSYDVRFRNYTNIEVRYPLRNVGGRLAYLGILSDYSRGYADGVASRDGEVDDLTNRILGLQEDLSQYQGKDYQQIYNLGYQAGLDENAQGAATFNSLFGNILTAPLTILNGLTDISFFGMPILTAILSLLMVAMALFLFKRFK